MPNFTPGLDRTGVLASVLCAIHCAAAPILLILAPTLGGLWVHPVSHLVIAAVVLPVAALALRSGFRVHRRPLVLILGMLGVGLVAIGAVFPYLAESAAAAGSEACDDCCPSIVIDEATGTEQIHIPPATILTTAGGIALIIAHLTNLRCCAGCRAQAHPAP